MYIGGAWLSAKPIRHAARAATQGRLRIGRPHRAACASGGHTGPPLLAYALRAATQGRRYAHTARCFAGGHTGPPLLAYAPLAHTARCFGVTE